MRQIILEKNSGIYVKPIAEADRGGILPNAELKILSDRDLELVPTKSVMSIIVPINDHTAQPTEDLILECSLPVAAILMGYTIEGLVDGTHWKVLISGSAAEETFRIEEGDLFLSGRYVPRTNVKVLEGLVDL